SGFFFQAEDGIRDFHVTGVQTCALPISISPNVNDPGFRNTSFDQLRGTYREAIEGLIDGGADTLMVETVFDTLNAKAALFAIEEAFDARGARLPIMISGTITDASGRTLSGQTAEAFYASMAH